MAPNFKILSHRNSYSLHLKLIGDFEGNSACELINYLENQKAPANRVFIHSNTLDKVFSFGEAILQKNISSLKNSQRDFILTGDKLSLG